MPDLLIELFSEEIPARMQAKAADDLRRLVTDGLVEAGLTYAGAAAFATPRRLTLALEGLLAESPTLREDRRGPKVGAPDKAVDGFCRGAGVDRAALEERDVKGARFYFATVETAGRPAAEIVAEVVERTVRTFPWPKSMRWGDGALRWVRPLHAILCVLTDESGATPVPLTIDGIAASDTTFGHRFHAPDPLQVSSFEDYVAKLKRAYVILDPQERADAIWNDATNLAFAAGLDVVEDPSLLREVAGLVEWPVVLMGEIGERFLGLPAEVLQTSMREHQKFFSLRNPRTGRIERFMTVANRETADNGATILAGNQKVLAARLADAVFFWDNDLRVAKAGMSEWQDSLKTVTFHNKLGTVADQVERIAGLARALAPVVGADPDLAEEAALLAKADLASEMVYEFPELQGVMGRYYAGAAGRDAGVAAAIEEHYAPLGPSDAVPSAPVSVAVALAEKLDKLTGFWAIDEKPTGSKDPFALRRAALGVIRLVLDNTLRLSLDKVHDALILRYQAGAGVDQDHLSAVQADIIRYGVFSETVQAQAAAPDAPPWLAALSHHDPEISDSLLSFVHDRLKVYLRDQGIRHDVIDASIAMDEHCDLTQLVARARALQDVLSTEDGTNLVQGFKRANNILAQAEEKDGVEYSFGADRKFAETAVEEALFDALDRAEKAISSALERQDFSSAMSAMAALRPAVDAFFDGVQVNADNDIVRRNRLNLLSRIRSACTQVADLTRIEG